MLVKRSRENDGRWTLIATADGFCSLLSLSVNSKQLNNGQGEFRVPKDPRNSFGSGLCPNFFGLVLRFHEFPLLLILGLPQEARLN